MGIKWKRDELLPEVIIITNKAHFDKRGSFIESFNQQELIKAGISNNWIQDNVSRSAEGVIRGIHMQEAPYQQAKLVRCLNGVIKDVFIDLRPKSPTYGVSSFVVLSPDNCRMVYIPRGFGHGFQSIGRAIDMAIVSYKVDNIYSKLHETGIHPMSPEINKHWSSNVRATTISQKDLDLPPFNLKTML